MTRKLFVTVFLLTFGLLNFSGCGSSGNGEVEEWGADLGLFFEVPDFDCNGPTGLDLEEGGFSLVVQEDTMSACVNADNPNVAQIATLPDEFASGTNDTNITSGIAGYTVSVGDYPFMTDAIGNVTLTVPYDAAQPNTDGNNTSTHVFLRIFDPVGGATFPVTGRIVGGDKIEVNLGGLPANFTVAVFYNPNMATVSSDVLPDAFNPIWQYGLVPDMYAAATAWDAAKWCVHYDAKAEDVIAAHTTWVEDNIGKTIADMMKEKIANNAIRAQRIYQDAGFQTPILAMVATAADPCGDTDDTTSRYLIHMEPERGNCYASGYEDGTLFGRVYISAPSINRAATESLGSVLAAIAHELLHAVQRGYFSLGQAGAAVAEGTATSYGVTIDKQVNDAATVPHVRSHSDGETQELSNYLMINTVSSQSNITVEAYANQDFFAYVGRKYNDNNLDYTAGLLAKITDVLDATWKQAAPDEVAKIMFAPSRPLVYRAMDEYFKATFAGNSSLADLYIDFLRNRAMEHNEHSKLRSGDGDGDSKFVPTLFEYREDNRARRGRWEPKVNPLSVGSNSIAFSGIRPFSSRAVRITPTQAIAAGGTGATITVNVAPSTGSVGTTFGGAAYNNGVPQNLAANMTFSNFGMAATDEIVVLLGNITNDTTASATITISGQNGSDPSPDPDPPTPGQNAFTLTTFNLTGEPTMTPRYVTVVEASGVVFVQVSAASDLGDFANKVMLQIQFNTNRITGAGNYSLGQNIDSVDASVWYTPQQQGTNTFFSATGTMNLTSFGTSTGSTIKGTFSANMEDPTEATRTGQLVATFEFHVPSSGPLQ